MYGIRVNRDTPAFGFNSVEAEIERKDYYFTVILYTPSIYTEII